MKRFVKKKKIIINTRGALALKGGVSGPIEIPYMEDTDVICKMIMRGYKVFEILEDKTKVKLDLSNYNVDLNPPKEEPIKVKAKPKKEYTPIKPKQRPIRTTPRVIITGEKKSDPYEII